MTILKILNMDDITYKLLHLQLIYLEMIILLTVNKHNI
jgi:hypothetical protein